MDGQQNTSPQMCGFYSITTDQDFVESTSSLKYFKFPKVPLDLNKGIGGIKEKPDSYFERKMHNLLKYIIKHKADLVKKEDQSKKTTALIPSTKYVTFRGVIRSIMCSTYETRSGWCILATKYKGNIYMCHLPNMKNRNAFKNAPFSQKRFYFYGSKFEQCCLSDDPSKMPDTSKQVDECPEFYCVFKRKLIGRSFLFAAEMDGLVSDTPLDLDNPDKYNDLKFIELKVCADPDASPRTRENFIKFKCQNAWTQSFLTGVDDIYFGFRDYHGIVWKIDHYNIDKLRSKWEEYWGPSECFNFLNDFLELVDDQLENIDSPSTVCEFNYDENTSKISHKMHEGNADLCLLPKWYLDAVNS